MSGSSTWDCSDPRQAPEALRLAALGVPALALIGALALACFAKVSGVVFLGHPRTAGAERAHEVPRALLVPMFVLGGACVLLGVAPGLGVLAVVDVAAAVAGAKPNVAPEAIAVVRDSAWVSVVALALLALLAAGWLVRRTLLRRRRGAIGGDLGLRVSIGVAAHAVHRVLVRRATALHVRQNERR